MSRRSFFLLGLLALFTGAALAALPTLRVAHAQDEQEGQEET